MLRKVKCSPSQYMPDYLPMPIFCSLQALLVCVQTIWQLDEVYSSQCLFLLLCGHKTASFPRCCPMIHAQLDLLPSRYCRDFEESDYVSVNLPHRSHIFFSIISYCKSLIVLILFLNKLLHTSMLFE